MKKTIKVIDLLNMIANGKETPKKIKIDHWCYKFEWIEHDSNYYDKHENIDLMSCLSMDKEELNYGVQIIEEDEEPKEIELLDIKCENERTGNCYILNKNGTKCFLTKHSKMIVEQQNKIAKAVNYLLKKDEEK